MKKKVILSTLFCFLMWLSASNTFALTITKSGGWLETAYVQWSPVGGTTNYTVTYTGGGKTNQVIDTELIRQYSSAGYWRADVLGLKAGTYSITVTGGGESATVNNISVQAHDRSGFAHSSVSTWGSASGAYNDDGTLKTGARVIYVTPTNNAATTSYTMVKPDGTSGTYVGIAEALLGAYQKYGTSAQPLAVRIIGKVTNAQIGVGTGTDALLQIKGKDPLLTLCEITIEGVGNDATAYGWGIKVVKSGNVEVRNLGIMGFGDDGTQIQDGNYNIWVHNCDYFYGAVGSAADQAKGDGSLDSKESGYCTYSYNHFWDAGKCNLLGMHDPVRMFLSYHHNWYDHSDSRHPRARVHWAHVYNNFYDGVSEYGGGAAECSNLFCEGNYFKNTDRPMVISMQGNGGTTFSSEDGGMIKAWDNTLDNCTRYIPYSTSNGTDFDYYDASSRTEAVPASVTAKQGGCTFTNITMSDMNATPQNPATAKATVMSLAGRCEGGDLKFQFTDADNPLSHDRIGGIGSVLDNYDPTGEITTYDPNTGAVINSSVPMLSLTSTTATTTQTVGISTAITPITYSIGGTATGATVTGLPAGITGTLSGTTFTISGSSSAAVNTYNYTVTTVPAGASLTGSITLTNPPLATPAGVTATATSTSATIDWSAVTNATGYTVNFCEQGAPGSASAIWDFTGTWSIDATDASDANLELDATPTRLNYLPSTTNAALVFDNDGSEIPDVAGLKFTQAGGTKIRLGFDSKLLYLNGGGIDISIPCASGDKVTIIGPAGNSAAVDRGYSVTGGTLVPAECVNVDASGIMNVAGADGTWVYTATSSNLVLTTVTSGMNVKSITVAGGTPAPVCTESSVTGTTFTKTGLTPNTTYSYQVKATSTNPAYAASAYSTLAEITTPLSSIAAPDLVLTSGDDAQSVNAGAAITSIVYTASGTATGITVTGLPIGASVAYSGGNLIATITGTPTTLGATSYTVTATNGSTAQDVSLTGSITVVGPSITLSSATGTDNQTVNKNTAITSIIYAASGSATGATVTGLPAGLSTALVGSNLTISGSPTETGTFNYTVTTTGGAGSASATGTITVNIPPMSCVSNVTIDITGVASAGTYELILFSGATEVKTLANGSFLAGDTKFQFPSNAVAAGTYTYKLLNGATVLKTGTVIVP